MLKKLSYELEYYIPLFKTWNLQFFILRAICLQICKNHALNACTFQWIFLILYLETHSSTCGTTTERGFVKLYNVQS